LLGEGVARASEKIGADSGKFALHIKGQELPMHDPRWKQGMGVGYAVSPTGAEHCANMHDSSYTGLSPLFAEMKSLGIPTPLALTDLSSAKMRLLKYNTEWIHFLNCSVCCFFVMFYGLVGFERVARLVNNVTGWQTTTFELMKVGERALTMARAFNAREGFTGKEDTMPARFFTPQVSGGLKEVALDPEAFQAAIETYYEMMGWPGGSPSLSKLGELGIEWIGINVSDKEKR
jgi:aldehyde:ferredoxin oxidoreductase